jgi:hypothetical protein
MRGSIKPLVLTPVQSLAKTDFSTFTGSTSNEYKALTAMLVNAIFNGQKATVYLDTPSDALNPNARITIITFGN